MWEFRGSAYVFTGWPAQALATTRAAGNMRDEARRNCLCRSISIPPERIVRCRQVHGATVTPVSSRQAGSEVPDSDGLITDENDLSLAIFTADCVPVLFCDNAGTVAAAVHAGWRGLAAGIIPNTVRLFRELYGVAPSALHAASGPHIQKCCYPVGAEVKAAFHLENSQTHCDLAAILDRELEQCGVAPAVRLGECTGHREDLFFSYRKDATSHRIMTVIRLKG